MAKSQKSEVDEGIDEASAAADMSDGSENQLPQGKEVVGSDVNDRIAALEELAAKADEVAAAEETEPVEEGAAADSDEGSDGQKDDVPEPKLQPLVKLKIAGKEVELPLDEVIARAQKVESADEYLRRASEKLGSTVKPEPSAEELQRLQDEEDKALARAIQVGTQEEAVAALRKLRSQAGAHLSTTTDDVSRAIDERLAFNEAIRTFNAEFGDLLSNPLLKKLALTRDQELVDSGDRRPYLDRYRSIGNELRKFKDGLVAEEIRRSGSLEEKQLKKASAKAVPNAASARNKAPVDDVEETPQEIVAQMARSRGRPEWMSH